MDLVGRLVCVCVSVHARMCVFTAWQVGGAQYTWAKGASTGGPAPGSRPGLLIFSAPPGLGGSLGGPGEALTHSCVLSLRPLDAGACLSQMHGWAPLQVLHGHAEVLFPVSGVGSYGPAGGCPWFLPASLTGCGWSSGRRGRISCHVCGQGWGEGRRGGGGSGQVAPLSRGAPVALACLLTEPGYFAVLSPEQELACHLGAPRPASFLVSDLSNLVVYRQITNGDHYFCLSGVWRSEPIALKTFAPLAAEGVGVRE